MKGHFGVVSKQKVSLYEAFYIEVILLRKWSFGVAMLKLIYSEKATKFCEIFTLLLSYYVVPLKSKVKISQKFVAFSECMNFTSGYIVLQQQTSLKITFKATYVSLIEIYTNRIQLQLLFSNHKLAIHISNKKFVIVNLHTIYVLFNQHFDIYYCICFRHKLNLDLQVVFL